MRGIRFYFEGETITSLPACRNSWALRPKNQTVPILFCLYIAFMTLVILSWCSSELLQDPSPANLFCRRFVPALCWFDPSGVSDVLNSEISFSVSSSFILFVAPCSLILHLLLSVA